ncbi:SseB family protein [Streptomyces sp. NPDC001407]|uniref:SseB family protein n=1 Tax=Streptomyces sp. NPDC001407 TaxID=3364573 RepID=UPI00368BBDF9
MALTDEIGAIHAVRGRPTALIGEFRRTAVLVPLDGQGGLWTAEFGGVLWIHAFTDEDALARFAVARGEAARDWEYRSVLGARLLDVVVPAVGEPTGVALDVGGERPMMFPPVAGIVPDHAAVDGGIRRPGVRRGE